MNRCETTTKRMLLGSMLAVAGLLVGSANGALVTSVASLTNPTVVDFSQFSGCNLFGFPGCGAPIDVGGLVGETIDFTGSGGGFLGASAYNEIFGLFSNGDWTDGRNGFLGLNNQAGNTPGFMTLTFSDGAVAAVGGFVNYSPGQAGSPIISALDASGGVLETYDLSVAAPIVTTGAIDDGAFRGIVRPTADIFALRFDDGFQVVDDLAFSRVVVPEPNAWILLGIGILMLCHSKELRCLKSAATH